MLNQVPFAKAAWLTVALLAATIFLSGQGSKSEPNLEQLGPKVGLAAPSFAGTDQFGQFRTLQSLLGPQGAMLVFFRSADW